MKKFKTSTGQIITTVEMLTRTIVCTECGKTDKGNEPAILTICDNCKKAEN